MQKQTNQKGFTIIEVVLVLAIAGLIFLIVFLAVPALQRSQRDTQRRSDISRALSLMSNYQANNAGAVPTTAAQRTNYTDNYLKVATEFKAPNSASAYTITWGTAATAPGVNEAQIAVARVCNGEALTTTAASARNVAIRVGLEGGGTYCTSQ